MSYVQTNQTVTLPVGGAAGAFSISAADSGKMLLLPSQNVAQTITLPLAQAGLHYQIMSITGAATMGTNATIQAPLVAGVAPNVFIGSLINVTATPTIAIVVKTSAAPANSVRFNAASVNGDYIDLNCDGSFWYVSGLSTVAGLA